KEVVAESLHALGPRAAGPFVAFDSTAVPPSLVESELFGHERASSTAAVGAPKALLERAHGGTLLRGDSRARQPPRPPKLPRAAARAGAPAPPGRSPLAGQRARASQRGRQTPDARRSRGARALERRARRRVPPHARRGVRLDR